MKTFCLALLASWLAVTAVAVAGDAPCRRRDGARPRPTPTSPPQSTCRRCGR